MLGRDFWAGLVVTMIFLGAYIAYDRQDNDRVVYVKIAELYNEFEMKKNLENQFSSVQKVRKQFLDSMELELNILAKRYQTEKNNKELINVFESKRENYLMKKKQFEEDNEQMHEQYTAQISKQLNQYIQDYGKEKKYKYILGAEGSGTLMYGREEDDITKEVLVYINQKFGGKK